MLALTEGAAEAIRQLTEVPDAEGVRISADPAGIDGSQPALRLELADGPQEDDAVVEAAGAQLYLEPAAMGLLDDKVLDANVAAGQVSFAVMERPEGAVPPEGTEPPGSG